MNIKNKTDVAFVRNKVTITTFKLLYWSDKQLRL